jgi:hypothetical protein
VVFEYRPPGLVVAVTASAFALIVLVVLAWPRRRGQTTEPV